MSEIVVRADNLSKLYRIGAAPAAHRTAHEVLADLFASPIRVARRLVSGGVGRLAANTLWALKDVSFEVPRGEVLGIIGRNGAGKSTLLRILSRITKPTSGTALITGRVGSLLEVGTGFHPELTGRENIYLNGAILGMRRQEITRKFDEIVAFSEIERFLDTPVKRYSSGMYVRLAFAVAAHLEPEILIVDEVLAVGDVAFQAKCLGKMGNVALEGRTVFFVSHSMPAVRRLCQKALLIDQGCLIMHGSADSVVERYLLQDQATDEAIFRPPASSAVSPGSASALRLLGGDGQTRARFRIGEKWRIALDFDIRRFTQHVIAGVGILTRESVPIITYYSEPADLQPGTYTVEFDCDLSLAKAELRFAIGLSSFERAFYFCDAVGRAVVEDVAMDSQPFRATGSGLLISRTRPTVRPTDVPK